MDQSVAPSEIAIAGARPSYAGSTEGSATGAALVAAFSAAAFAESSQLRSLSGAGGQNRSKVSSTAATLTRTRSDHGGLKYLETAAAQAFRAYMSTVWHLPATQRQSDKIRHYRQLAKTSRTSISKSSYDE